MQQQQQDWLRENRIRMVREGKRGMRKRRRNDRREQGKVKEKGKNRGSR